MAAISHRSCGDWASTAATRCEQTQPELCPPEEGEPGEGCVPMQDSMGLVPKITLPDFKIQTSEEKKNNKEKVRI